MAAVDAAWLHMDRPTNELIVNAVLWFDEPLSDELIREAVTTRLVGQHARFGQRVEDSGTAAWWITQPLFDPMTHVTRTRLPDAATHDDLTRHVSTLVSTPLPRDRPLWKLHVVDGYLGGTALVARMHHCIADGVALFRVLLSLSDEAADGGLGAPQEARPRPPRRLAVNTLKAARALGGLIGLPPDVRTPLRGPLGTGKTVTWSAPIPLDAIKIAAKAGQATINDLVLAALSGALSRHGDRDVRAVLPVNLRPLDTAEIELGNRFGLVFLRLPVTEDGPRRIATIHRRTEALKRSATAPVALAVLGLVGRAHRRLVGLVIGIFSAKGSLVVTNVPGPRETLHLGGRPLTGIIAWPPQSGSIGLGVSVISYAGQVRLGVMSDDRIVPDPEALLADLRAELVALGVDLGA
jgi:diacylglycerol O-acyltransferase